MPRMTAPNGATVSVTDDKVEGLERRGFKVADKPKKAPAKKSASSTSRKSN